MIRTLVLLLMLFSSVVVADPASIAPAPLSSHWGWTDRPLKGNVTRVDVTRTVVDGSGRYAPVALSYFRLPDQEQRIVKGSPRGIIDAVVDRDAAGKVVRIVSLSRRANPQTKKLEQVEQTETATYTADGILEKVTITRVGEPETVVTFKALPQAGGNRALQWQFQPAGASAPRTTELLFDAEGRVVRWTHDVARPKENPPQVFEYNEKGDVKRMAAGERSEDLFEYTYDDQGNWKRCERTIVRNNDRKTSDVIERVISYGEPPAVPQDQLAVNLRRNTAPAAAPVPVKPAFDLPAAKPGAERFRKTLGKRGAGLYMEMTIVLNPDKSGSFVSISESNGSRSVKAAVASWELQGNDIAFELVKSLDGAEIPEAARVMHLSRNDAGDLVMQGDPTSPFKKLKDGE